MRVSKFLWFDVVFTTSYHNRMPFGVFDGEEIPLRGLHLDVELFHLPPKVFGCAFRICLDKLSPRSIKCAFVSYSCTQKDYWCYHPLT